MKTRNPDESAGPPDRQREMALYGKGLALVAGVDEVGRGALAGPVVAAAVVLLPDRCPDGLDDSKKLSPEVREQLFHAILSSVHAAAVYMVGPDRIDAMNILRASQEAMRRAVLALPSLPEMALVDGLPVPGFPCPHLALVKGDAKECCIAAASIVAKVTRDRLMEGYGACYPQYGFQRHRGYATAFHRGAIDIHGPCPIHRRTFLKDLAGKRRPVGETMIGLGI